MDRVAEPKSPIGLFFLTVTMMALARSFLPARSTTGGRGMWEGGAPAFGPFQALTVEDFISEMKAWFGALPSRLCF